MEPDAYESLIRELKRRRAIAVQRTLDHAAGSPVETVRFHAGIMKGLDDAIAVLEGD
jgi:hypothetical protein